MTLLFLSWAYPPMAFPRAVQVARLAQHLTERPLKIFCLAPQGDRVEYVAERESGIDIVRIPRGLLTRTLERMLPLERRRILQNIDVNKFWWRGAAHFIATQETIGIDDVLVTFGQPMAGHRAGLKLKQTTGVHWIAHFSDPWADNPFLAPKARAAASRLEAEVISNADGIIFTSKETVDLVLAKYPDEMRRKTAVVPHAFEPTFFPKVMHRSGPLIIRYLGNLFSGRGPEPLFQALAIIGQRAPALVMRLRVELIGEIPREMHISDALAGLPPELVQFFQRVPYSESLALMRSADLLLNIDAPGTLSVFLPSKLVEYIGTGRPILGITPPGTASDLIEELGGWVADPADPDAIANALEKALAYVESHRNEPWGKLQVRERFAAPKVAAHFEKIVSVSKENVA